jgi:hypothetical protein
VKRQLTCTPVPCTVEPLAWYPQWTHSLEEGRDGKTLGASVRSQDGHLHESDWEMGSCSWEVGSQTPRGSSSNYIGPSSCPSGRGCGRMEQYTSDTRMCLCRNSASALSCPERAVGPFSYGAFGQENHLGTVSFAQGSFVNCSGFVFGCHI